MIEDRMVRLFITLPTLETDVRLHELIAEYNVDNLHDALLAMRLDNKYINKHFLDHSIENGIYHTRMSEIAVYEDTTDVARERLAMASMKLKRIVAREKLAMASMKLKRIIRYGLDK